MLSTDIETDDNTGDAVSKFFNALLTYLMRRIVMDRK